MAEPEVGAKLLGDGAKVLGPVLYRVQAFKLLAWGTALTLGFTAA